MEAKHLPREFWSKIWKNTPKNMCIVFSTTYFVALDRSNDPSISTQFFSAVFHCHQETLFSCFSFLLFHCLVNFGIFSREAKSQRFNGNVAGMTKRWVRAHWLKNAWNDYMYIPRAPMTSIFEGQPPQNKAFSNQNKGHLGSTYTHMLRFIYIYIYAMYISNI